MKLPIIISAALILFSSCYSYKIFPKETRDYTYSGPRQKAYILNPQLKKEYKILRSSKVFDLTSDSAEATIIIKLRPIKSRPSCGQPLTGSLVTLGQVPIYLPDRYQYSFEEISKDINTSHSFEIQIATRVWFWDIFVFNKKFDQKAGQVLLSDYYSQ
jgi:hypothetical protein